MAHVILIVVYVGGAISELAGIILTGFLLIGESHIQDRGNGTSVWVVPGGWRRYLGPGLIVLGIVAGVAGNIASIYVLSNASSGACA